jgi:hypothetical protein
MSGDQQLSQAKVAKSSERSNSARTVNADDRFPELVALLRVLLQEPPIGHDFATCPICRRYGIARI